MRKITTALASACVIALATATGAMAQTSQSGLVNINVEDNVVQVPIAIAANICDVTVAVPEVCSRSVPAVRRKVVAGLLLQARPGDPLAA